LSTESKATRERDVASFFSIRIEPDSGLASIVCSGALGAEQAREGVSALWAHPDWNGVAAVWDFREAQFDMSTGDARAIALFVLQNQRPAPPARVAFVTRRDVDFGLARVFEVHREQRDTEFRVFRSFEEAVAWARPAAGDRP